MNRVILFLVLAVISGFYFGLVDTSVEHQHWGMKITVAMLVLAGVHFLAHITRKRPA